MTLLPATPSADCRAVAVAKSLETVTEVAPEGTAVVMAGENDTPPMSNSAVPALTKSLAVTFDVARMPVFDALT